MEKVFTCVLSTEVEKASAFASAFYTIGMDRKEREWRFFTLKELLLLLLEENRKLKVQPHQKEV